MKRRLKYNFRRVLAGVLAATTMFTGIPDTGLSVRAMEDLQRGN